MTVLHKVDVDLGQRSYAIHIGKGLTGDAAGFLPFDPAGRTFFILADENIDEMAVAALLAGLKAAGARDVQLKVIAGGEASKSWKQLESILSWLLDHGVDRQSVLFTVGGGVIGDLGGFAASIVLRGIPFVQVPTTLLAQVDSAVGGKTGINFPQGKNLVGTFHQPSAVICDLDLLETLPRREVLAGYAEIVKYGLINDREFFIWLESHGHEVCALEPEALARAIAASCRKKAEIVERDEREEEGGRALLNLGHTFGHALEAAAGYDGRLLHGEAVAIGMALAFRLSSRLGLCPESDADRVADHLRAIGLPVRIDMITPPLWHGIDELMAFIKHDKKTVAGRTSFILARGIGRAFVSPDVPAEDVRYVMQRSAQGD